MLYCSKDILLVVSFSYLLADISWQYGLSRLLVGIGWWLAGSVQDSVWDRFGIGLGSGWDRVGIGLGSVWDQFGIGLRSV